MVIVGGSGQLSPQPLQGYAGRFRVDFVASESGRFHDVSNPLFRRPIGFRVIARQTATDEIADIAFAAATERNNMVDSSLG